MIPAALPELMRRIENAESLDQVAKPVSKFVSRVVSPAPIRSLLSGTWLGHPLHPLLSDVPIGAWSMAALLDAFDNDAADLLIGAGLAAAVPTAASGYNDWSTTFGAASRIGVVHAASNGTAVLLHGSSLIARRRGERGLGKVLSLAGLAAVFVGGYLGGHLSFVKGTGVNHTAWPDGPDSWTPVLADTDLAPALPKRVEARRRSGGPLPKRGRRRSDRRNLQPRWGSAR